MITFKISTKWWETATEAERLIMRRVAPRDGVQYGKAFITAIKQKFNAVDNVEVPKAGVVKCGSETYFWSHATRVWYQLEI